MKRSQFSVVYPERLIHPLHRTVVAATRLTRAELLMWSPTPDATTLVWFDGPRGAAERATDGIDSLVASRFVEEGDGTYAFLQQDDYEFASALLEAVAASRVIFLPPVAFLDTGEVRFEAVGESTALSALHDALSDLGEPTVEAVHDFERGGRPSRLTDRQAEALDAAVSVGYYDVPRSGGVADIAASLDCSTSTAGELVRKAEAAVVRGVVQGETVREG